MQAARWKVLRKVRRVRDQGAISIVKRSSGDLILRYWVCGGCVVEWWQLGKKGYVQMQTSVGNLNLEVHADFVPSTAENFLTLCANGAYDGTPFHRYMTLERVGMNVYSMCGLTLCNWYGRVIKGFMVQGGDPTGTGRGGESIYGKPFKDEFDRYIHTPILSYLINEEKHAWRFDRITPSCLG